MKQIKKVLVANRGEIATRIIRACNELGVETVAIYSKEDIGALHRQKADESYLIGEGLSPVEAYLDIEGIIQLAKAKQVDAVHPGYGFLSENEQFARRLDEEGILFVGPDVRHLNMFGQKTTAREVAVASGLPVIPGTEGAIRSFEDAAEFADQYGYPLMIKAVSGGGGKGMRIVREASELEEAYQRASSEALSNFGDDRVYVERYLDNPQHIEIQILGGKHGHIVHLYERDCSIQRRHQKVVEVAPSQSLNPILREEMTQAAVKLMTDVGYVNAGTVEFLVADNQFYFIEVNPRVQVEHTITELVTGIDIVKAQLLIADGASLSHPAIGIDNQEEIRLSGVAIQCRITTEDPLADFAPDNGQLIGYHSPGGAGIRLDAGDAYGGATISPYYDSLLVKISSYANSYGQAIQKMQRALDELKVIGLKTNIRFLQNIMQNPTFQSGQVSTTFIDQTPELFDFKPSRNRGNKILNYLANVTVNGFPGIDANSRPDSRIQPQPLTVPQPADTTPAPSLKHILDKKGPAAVVEQIKATKDALVTDTSLRDAHQSLLATRMRTQDMLKLAPYMNATMQDYFSLEMWGGATFDVAYNFLKESPWLRLSQLHQAIPDIPFQMLLRASNAVGYTNYADNVIEKFIQTAAREGIDVFRIFDSLNWMESLKYPIEVALETGKLVEGTLCYTGDILDPNRSSIYTLDYYVKLAESLAAEGVHLIGIKDMSGILKPEAAYQLVSAIKESVDLPIHLHSHDTAANSLMTYSRAIDAGVDIVDTANAALAGHNGQPDANALYYARQGTDRQVRVPVEANDAMQDYWREVRKNYAPFESDLIDTWTGVYKYELPGGQYSNLQMQADAVGLKDRFDDVLDMYRRVNYLLGDIVKVTPSSKVVGDLALFMVQNDLDESSIIEQGMQYDFPDSVISFFRGDIGQPAGGMNKDLQKVVLKDIQPYTDRPGNHLTDFDFNQAEQELANHTTPDTPDLAQLSLAMYPKVYKDYLEAYDQFDDVSVLETADFFYGLEPYQPATVTLEPGKTLLIELTSVGPVSSEGTRVVYFKLNGMPEQVEVVDLAADTGSNRVKLADPNQVGQIPARMPGAVYQVDVNVGDLVEMNQVLIVTESMKMETAIKSPLAGRVKAIHVTSGDVVKAGQLLIEVEEETAE